MCNTANKLRLAWYAVAEQFSADAEMALVIESRDLEYQRALDRYRSHRLNCPTCASEMGREIPARLERVG